MLARQKRRKGGRRKEKGEMEKEKGKRKQLRRWRGKQKTEMSSSAYPSL